MFSLPCHPIIQSKVRHSTALFSVISEDVSVLHTSSVALKPFTSILSPSISGRIILTETDSGTKFQDPHFHRFQRSVAEYPHRLVSSGAHFHPGPWDPDWCCKLLILTSVLLQLPGKIAGKVIDFSFMAVFSSVKIRERGKSEADPCFCLWRQICTWIKWTDGKYSKSVKL